MINSYNLNQLLNKLNPIINYCSDKKPTKVEVKFDYNLNLFVSTYHFQGNMNNLVFQHQYNIDLSLIEKLVSENGGDKSKVTIKNIEFYLQSNYEKFLSELDLEGNNNKYDDLINYLTNPVREGLENMGF